MVVFSSYPRLRTLILKAHPRLAMAVPFRSMPLLTCVLTGLSYSAPVAFARADTCLATDSCLPLEQTATEHCLREQNNRLKAALESTENVVILSAHGSSIEQADGHLSSTLARFDNWNPYDFSDHGSATRVYWICG